MTPNIAQLRGKGRVLAFFNIDLFRFGINLTWIGSPWRVLTLSVYSPRRSLKRTWGHWGGAE